MMRRPNEPDEKLLRDAAASFATRLEALRRGRGDLSIRFSLDADHPLVALSAAIDDLAASVTEARLRRADAEARLEERVRREESAPLEPLAAAPPSRLSDDTLAIPVVGAIAGRRADRTMAGVGSRLAREGAGLRVLRRFRTSLPWHAPALEAAESTPSPWRRATPALTDTSIRSTDDH